jgi:hypothetical protein
MGKMATSKLLYLISVVLFVIAAVVANGTKIVVDADVWGFAGLAFMAGGQLM